MSFLAPLALLAACSGPADTGGVDWLRTFPPGGGDETGDGGTDATGPTGDGGSEETGQTGDGGSEETGQTGDGGTDGTDKDGGPPALSVGFRASSYGQHSLSDHDYWRDVAQDMAERFDGATPSGVWIVGVAGSDSTCYLNFPSPGGTWDDIAFSSSDANEAALTAFDEAGVKIWLQVEPGDAGVGELIELVMGRYAHHESVVGFGVDVEWFRFRNNPDGKAITDSQARSWRDAVREHDPDDGLFLKHWLSDRMPPTERDGLLFVDDGQGVGSLDGLVDYFAEWGETFSPAPVAFQYGYETDESWWSPLDDPPTEIGQALLDEIPNTEGLFWVDFTVEEVFPP